MHYYWNSLPVIPHGDLIVLHIDVHFDHIHGVFSMVIISRVDQYFVKYLVQAWDKFDLTMDNFVYVKDPQVLLVVLDGAYVGVGAEENVLQLSLFLIDLFDTHLILSFRF